MYTFERVYEWSAHLCKREHLFASECIQHSVSANSAVVAIHEFRQGKQEPTACKALTSVWCQTKRLRGCSYKWLAAVSRTP